MESDVDAGEAAETPADFSYASAKNADIRGFAAEIKISDQLKLTENRM